MKKLLIAVLFILSTVIPVIAQTENASDDTVAATVNVKSFIWIPFFQRFCRVIRRSRSV